MKNKILLTVIPLLAVTTLALVGCASYTIQPIAATELKAWNAKQLAQGYVFYHRRSPPAGLDRQIHRRRMPTKVQPPPQLREPALLV